MGQELTGKKIAILAEDLYEDTELWYPYYRLLEAGAEVKIVGSGGAESFKSKHALPVVPDLSIDRTSAAEFDAVVIPGGYSPDLMRRKPAMVEFVREMDKAGKPVAAICHAGWMLISAGIVKGRRATAFFSIKADIGGAGAPCRDEAGVVGGELITSPPPADLPQFVPAILEAPAGTRSRSGAAV